MGNSIYRYFDITPANNTGLNATLRFQYFDGEVNVPLIESSLILWKSINTTSWTTEGFTSRDVVANYVEKTGIAGFSRWTLSNLNNPLPVHFILFNVNCQNNRNKTALISRYKKSDDGIHFNTIGIVPAAGNSSSEKTYTYTDNSTSPNITFYRIAETDIDGRMQYTSINRIQCGTLTDELRIWPNPV